FLLARIKEARDRGLSTAEAVSTGLEHTGGLVTAAAGLFCVAIGVFATSSIVFIKELGVGTALAVLVDATIVRALLVPSLMALLRHWNWWAPRSLRAFHRHLHLDKPAEQHEPALEVA
ncbi:MAG TPA: MMPL family transporter, partial [Candidatus Dormibacteraeota bacterium]|nr:MMPL family transporter [Candidatus Dormibacteraeota bacterium]